MTREEASFILANIDRRVCDDELNDALDMAIKALEQEHILDKIRAEIKALSNANPSYWYSGDMVDRDDVIEIIDKYKAESEGK
jgi:hypothetical protein